MYLINFNFFFNQKKKSQKYNGACYYTVGEVEKSYLKDAERIMIKVPGIREFAWIIVTQYLDRGLKSSRV